MHKGYIMAEIANHSSCNLRRLDQQSDRQRGAEETTQDTVTLSIESSVGTQCGPIFLGYTYH